MASELSRYAAANARARALLSRRLGRPGLQALYSYPSVVQFFGALARTPYAAALAAPGAPERQLVRRVIAVARSLMAWMRDPERAFLHEYVLHYEVENLALLLRAVHARIAWEAVDPFIVPLDGLATIDLPDVAHATDVPALVERLAGSRYSSALHNALHRLPDAGPFALAVALELDYYDRLWRAADTLRPADTLRARRLLGVLYDILNLGLIAHYRDVWRLSPEEILNYTLRDGAAIDLQVRRTLAAEGSGRWQQGLGGTPYAALAGALESQGFEAVSPEFWRVLLEHVRAGMAGAPFHIGVPLGLVLIQEIEHRDLQALIAAKRLQLAPAEALAHVATGP